MEEMMDFIDRIREISVRIPKQLDHIQTEEATKNVLIMPFLSALGYYVFDPTEVTPKLVADIGVKKGEKVDYAILRQGKPIILVECKHHTVDLVCPNDHIGFSSKIKSKRRVYIGNIQTGANETGPLEYST